MSHTEINEYIYYNKNRKNMNIYILKAELK